MDASSSALVAALSLRTASYYVRVASKIPVSADLNDVRDRRHEAEVVRQGDMDVGDDVRREVGLTEGAADRVFERLAHRLVDPSSKNPLFLPNSRALKQANEQLASAVLDTRDERLHAKAVHLSVA